MDDNEPDPAASVNDSLKFRKHTNKSSSFPVFSRLVLFPSQATFDFENIQSQELTKLCSEQQIYLFPVLFRSKCVKWIAKSL